MIRRPCLGKGGLGHLGLSLGRAEMVPGLMPRPYSYHWHSLAREVDIRPGLLTPPNGLPKPHFHGPRFPKSRACVAFGEMRTREWTWLRPRSLASWHCALVSSVALAWSLGP